MSYSRPSSTASRLLRLSLSHQLPAVHQDSFSVSFPTLSFFAPWEQTLLLVRSTYSLFLTVGLWRNTSLVVLVSEFWVLFLTLHGLTSTEQYHQEYFFFFLYLWSYTTSPSVLNREMRWVKNTFTTPKWDDTFRLSLWNCNFLLGFLNWIDKICLYEILRDFVSRTLNNVSLSDERNL